MKRLVLFAAMAMMIAVIAISFPTQSHGGETAVSNASITPPRGYRDWRFISVAHEEGSLNDIRAILGNDAALKAYRDAKLPFPDGTIIARLAWNYAASDENNMVFGRKQSFMAGTQTNVQFIVKDSKKYADTGGWGFAQFTEGKPANEAVAAACFSCHQKASNRDFVFTRYAP